MFKTGAGFGIKFDMDQYLASPTGTPDFQSLCPTNVDKALNEAVDTFFRLCDEGYAQNILAALDPEYSMTLKGDDSDTVLLAIIDNELDMERRNRAGFEITDNLKSSNDVITIGATITEISDSRVADGVIEVTIVFKFRGKPTISTST